MAQIVKFSETTIFDSIGSEGFVETSGVEIIRVGTTDGKGVVLLYPIGPTGHTCTDCRVAVETDSIPHIIATLAQMMVDQRTRELLDVKPEDEDREVVEQISPHDLEMMFGPEGSCPEYPHETWLHEIRNGDTRTGYWEWVSDRLYNDTLERVMYIDHAAEMLLVMRAEVAREAFDAFDWSGENDGPALRGDWVVQEIGNYDAMRCVVTMGDATSRCFSALFVRGTSMLADSGVVRFDVERQKLV